MPVDAKRVQAVFLAVIEFTDADERAAALARECDGDSELRRRVLALVAAHDQSAELPPAGGTPLDVTTNPSELHRPGVVIAGRYKLLEQIGEGGMGAVWVAEQTEPVRRRVALKLIKPGMDTKQVLSRFAAERQALALMDHPNIAKVYDGGMTEEGRPFFVMEYVKGVPITDYCDQTKLPIEERLKLFLPICQAVQHAHQKGIIHRDLKPSNLLVCLYDGQPIPKVIDFGLAKAISQPLTEHTLYTAHGLMVGTPLYMSPEQAEFNNLDVDTRTDIYSLGVILYELLTGTTPLEKQKFKDAAFQEILRLIKEEEPPKPSTKISGSTTLPALAAQRGLQPAQLSKVVRGELDWIVMKALEKERSRRYETANGLTRDLERYLNDEPVEACPPSLGYKFNKFARRYRRALVTASLFGVVLLASLLTVAGSIGYVWSYLGTRQAVVERKIEQALTKAQNAYGRSDLKEASAAVTQAEGLLTSAEISSELTKRVTQWQTDLAMIDRLEKIHLEKALAVKDEHFDMASAAVPYTKAFSDYGLNFSQLGPLDAAQRLQQSAIKTYLVAALDDWAFLSDPTQQSRWLAISRQADPDPWRNRLRDAVEKDDADNLVGLAAEEVGLNQPAVTLAFLGARLHALGKRQAATALLTKANLRYPEDFWINEHLGNQLLAMSQPDEAATYLRVATRKAPNSAAARNALGVALAFGGKAAEAIEEYRAAIRLKRDFAMPHHNLGSALETLGNLEEAEKALREAVRLLPDAAMQYALANLLAGQGKFPEAEKLYQSAIALTPHDWLILEGFLDCLESSGGFAALETDVRKRLKERPDDPLLHRFLGDLLARKQSLAEAEAAYQAAIRLNENDAVAHTRLAMVLAYQNKPQEAQAACRAAIQLEPNSAWAHYQLGITLYREQKFPEAEIALKTALDLAPNLTYGYTALQSSLRSQNKSTAGIRRENFGPGNLQLPGRAPARVATYLKGQFELGTLNLSANALSVTVGLFRRSGRGGFFPPSNLPRDRPNPTSRDEAALRLAIQRNPKDSEAREKLCALLLQQKSSGAYSTIWEAICADPTNPKFHAFLGDAFGPSRNYAEAALRESIRLKANDAYPYRLLAKALSNQGKHSEAVASARKAVDLEKDNVENHKMLGWCLDRQGDLPGAEGAYREMLKLDMQNLFGHFDLAGVLRRMGKVNEANAQIKQGSSRSRERAPPPHSVLVEYYSRNSQFNNALLQLEAALAEKADDSWSSMRAAFLLLLQGDRSGYERHCQEMLKRFGQTTQPPDARRTVHTCLITPQIIGDLPTHARLEEVFLRSPPTSAFLVLREQALLAYRRGEWDRALRLSRQSGLEADNSQATNRPANDEAAAISQGQLRLYRAQNLLVEAMALHRQGEPAAARQAYSTAVGLNAASYPFAPESLDAAWVDWVIYELLRREAQPLLGIDDSIDWRELVARGRALAAAGDWKSGAAELARACQSPAATSLQFVATGTAFARAGDREGLRNFCQSMLERFSNSKDWQELERTVNVCSLLPMDMEIPSEVLAAVSKDIDNGSLQAWLASWGNVARARAAYRQDRFSEAAQWGDSAAHETSAQRRSRAQGFLISALAHQKLSDSKTAKQRLASALELYDEEPWPKLAGGLLDERLLLTEFGSWWEIVGIDLMRREAVALIGDVQPASTPPASPPQPAQPLLADAAVKSARRIKGWVASWSPDGKKIVRNLDIRNQANADLEVMNLITGTTTKLYRGGKDPAWSPLPGGPIAFVRYGSGGSDLASEEIWLIQPDGSNPRKLTSGGFPTWTNDGRLFYRTGSASTLALQVINPAEPNSQPQNLPGANTYPAVSPDGILTATAQRSPPSFIVRNAATQVTVARVNLEQVGLPLASWSPDGRYVAYGDYVTGAPAGLWLLDVQTGRTRLLTSERLTCPRWSPDGKTIAADDRQRSELVILDVSSLDLENGLPDAGSTESSPPK